jgi:hypothetical protein
VRHGAGARPGVQLDSPTAVLNRGAHAPIGLAVVLTLSVFVAPLVAEAQPTGRGPRIGWFATSAPGPFDEAFRQGSRSLRLTLNSTGPPAPVVAQSSDQLVNAPASRSRDLLARHPAVQLDTSARIRTVRARMALADCQFWRSGAQPDGQAP